MDDLAGEGESEIDLLPGARPRGAGSDEVAVKGLDREGANHQEFRCRRSLGERVGPSAGDVGQSVDRLKRGRPGPLVDHGQLGVYIDRGLAPRRPGHDHLAEGRQRGGAALVHGQPAPLRHPPHPIGVEAIKQAI